ncbi:MAG TPA: universal stress protein [Chloroflexi bacterium]|nr:universal stress protein [Chloroflexota bacterium]
MSSGTEEMYHNVVVLLDGSELSEGVLPHVAEMVRGRGSRVYLLSVIPDNYGTTMSPAEDRIVVSDRAQPHRVASATEETRAYLQMVAGQLQPAAEEICIEVRCGPPAEEILAFVETIEADLVVMSSHGRSGIGRWVFGSVADRVLREVTCPALLVRSEAARQTVPYRHIVLPLDGSELAEQIVAYVKALVRSDAPEATRISLLSVLPTGLTDRVLALLVSYPPGLQWATPAYSQAEAQAQLYLRSVASALRERGSRIQVRPVIRYGTPANEILTYIEESDADLVAMTTHGVSGIGRWTYGGVADKVIHGVHCPILLVRPLPPKRKKQGE